MINLWVSRGMDGTEQLAVLIVTFPFIHVTYGWLNELKNLAAAYKGDTWATSALRPFYLASMGVALGLVVLLAWSPVGHWLLLYMTGISPQMFTQCKIPLRLFILWPPAVALRSYIQGSALRERRTESIAAAGPIRVLAIFLTLQIFSLFQFDRDSVIPCSDCSAIASVDAGGLPGAVLGTIALCVGFWAEALACLALFNWRCWAALGKQVCDSATDNPRHLPNERRDEKTGLI